MFNKWIAYPACVFYCLVAYSLDIKLLMFWAPFIVIGCWFKLLGEATSSKNGYLFIFALIGWPVMFLGLLTLK